MSSRPLMKVKLRSMTRHVPGSVEKSPPDVPSESKSANAKYSHAFRERLKQDPEKWAQYKAQQAARAREYRKNRSAEGRERERELNRERQRRFNAKRKAARQADDEEEPKRKVRKILTRKEREKKREYDREKKREERARMSSQKKRRIREYDAQRKRKKKEREKEEKRKRNMRRKGAQNIEVDEATGGSTSGYRTGSAKRMARARAWQQLPKQADQFATVVVDLIGGVRCTPRKRAALRAQGIICRKTVNISLDSLDSFRSTINDLKKKHDSSSLATRQLLVSAMMIVKKYRAQSELARNLQLRPGYLTTIARRGNDNLVTTMRRQRRRTATNTDLIEEIQNFYTHPSVARELPCMSTVAKQRQRFIMEVTIHRAHALWKESKPDKHVSLSVFSRLRPAHVLLQRRMKLNSCLCEYCTDVLLKIRSLNRALNSQGEQGKLLKIQDKYELVKLSMCDKGESTFHKPACINRTCPSCGISKLKDRFEEFRENFGELRVTWQCWESELYTHDGKQKSKKVQKTKAGTLSELMDDIFTETETLSKHLFNAKWQQEQFNLLKMKLPNDWVMLVLDFAENYSCVSQDEIQSAHWATNQVTVHPTVAYYRCEHEDGTSHLCQEAIVFLSDDLTHDAHAVQHYEKVTMKHLTEKRGLKIEHIVEFTDGCSCQYKSKLPFADISFSNETLGSSLERSYFGSRHGKGPSDGVSGVVKAAARRAVTSRQAVINSAADMFSFCEDQLSREKCQQQRRSFYLVKRGDVQRDRPDREVKAALAGTRVLHSVKGISPGVLDTRLLSCFCDGCMYGTNECANTTYVQPWQRRALKLKQQPMEVVDLAQRTPIHASLEDSANEENNINDLWKKLMGSAQVVEDEPQPLLEPGDPSIVSEMLTDSSVTPSIDFILNTNIDSEYMFTPWTASVEDLQDRDGTELHPESSSTSVDFPKPQDVEKLTNTNFACDSVKTGDFVAVLLHVLGKKSDVIFMGQVLDVADGSAHISFMKKCGDNTYMWPRNKDESWEPTQSILGIMSVPTIANNREQYKFKTEDINLVSSRMETPFKYQ